MFVPLPIKSKIEVIPKKMVTHNWSNLFRDLVATVIADALGEHAFEFVAELLCDKHGVKLLQETLRVHGCLEETYWICAFAVNQHAGICGANPNGDIDPVTKIPHPTCACSAPKFFNEDPPLNEHGESIQCEMNKFDDMMAFLSKKDNNFTEVIAVDADLNLFQRSWCIAELAEAHRMGMAQNLMLRNKATLMNRQCTLEGLQVENMKASRPEDVQQILAKIPDKKAFNKKLQELIFDGTTGFTGLLEEGRCVAANGRSFLCPEMGQTLRASRRWRPDLAQMDCICTLVGPLVHNSRFHMFRSYLFVHPGTKIPLQPVAWMKLEGASSEACPKKGLGPQAVASTVKIWVT